MNWPSRRGGTQMTNFSTEQQGSPSEYRLRAVIFDWAGTIVDFGSRAPVLAVLEAFRRLDLAITVDQARGPMGMAKRDHVRAVLELPEVQARWRQSHGRPSNDADVDAIYRTFLPLQRELLEEHSQLILGCIDAVRHCRWRAMKIGTSTGYTRELIDRLASLAAEQGFVPDAIVCADDVPAGRPAPWMCLENARRLGVDPVATVVVDDTEVGIEAGRNAGMWTVGVAASGNLVGLSPLELAQLEPVQRISLIHAADQRLRDHGAHWVIDSVADLPAALDGVEQQLRRGDRP